MKIGIISDTHDCWENVARAASVFEREKVYYIFHAGDIESAGTAEMFAGINDSKFIAVFGNCDLDRAELSESIERFGGQISETYEGQIEGRNIFMSHKPELAQTAIKSGKFELVIYGHTHKLEIRKIHSTVIVNPGTSKKWHMGSSHVAIVKLGDLSVEMVPLIY